MVTINKKGNTRVVCPSCGCDFNFEPEDTFRCGIAGINRGVACPTCGRTIVVAELI